NAGTLKQHLLACRLALIILRISTRDSRPNVRIGSELRRWGLGPSSAKSGPRVIGYTDNAARRSCPTSLLRNVGSSYSEEPGGFCSMAKLVFGMNQSLDGYVDHLEFRPSPALFRHFI